MTDITEDVIDELENTSVDDPLVNERIERAINEITTLRRALGWEPMPVPNSVPIPDPMPNAAVMAALKRQLVRLVETDRVVGGDVELWYEIAAFKAAIKKLEEVI